MIIWIVVVVDYLKQIEKGVIKMIKELGLVVTGVTISVVGRLFKTNRKGGN